MNYLTPVAVFGSLSLALSAQEVQAGLYRPPEPALVMVYPPAKMNERIPLKPVLHLYGRGFPKGKGSVAFRIMAGAKELHRGEGKVEVPGAAFELPMELDEACPGADRVEWKVDLGQDTWHGSAPLRWSRLSGKVEFVDGRLRPMYLDLHPFTFSSVFTVPVKADGSFDAELPARSYAVINVNGAGYSIDAMERWAWDFDLSRDRSEVFKVGRTELYGIHTFCLLGGVKTVFVVFRASALTRILQHRADPGAAPKDAATMSLLKEHLKIDPMAIAPDIPKAKAHVWLDGVAYPVSDLSRVVETDQGGVNQTLYILQFLPDQRPSRGVRHEVKVEVESQDVLDGRLISDFGQGSAGLLLD